jgi:cysteine desulfurase
VRFDVRAAGADLLAITAHRFGGPKGIGALRIARGVRVRPLIEGGTQEWGLRAGTEHVAGIVGMGVAAEIALAEMASRERFLRDLTAALRAAISRADPTVRFSSPEQGGIPGYVHASFPGVDGEALASLLDAEGVAASTGSACIEGTGKPSHVLLAMGLSAEEARGSLLLTLAASNTADEIERFGAILTRALARLRAISPPPHA